MKHLGKGLVFGSALAFSLLLSGCGPTIQDQPQATQGSNATDIGKSSDVLITGGLFDTSKGKQLVISATDISSGQTKAKTAFAKTGQKVENFLAGHGFVASADVANLPASSINIANITGNSKRITFINNHQFLYLADTDDKDHAKSLDLYDTATGQSTVLYQAQSSWGIDEYVLSPDQSIAALLEVQIGEDATQLLGAKTQVVQINLGTKESKIVVGPRQTENLTGNDLRYAQASLSSSVCFQYPLFYDSKNTLWLNTFCPNAAGLYDEGLSDAGIYQIIQGSDLVKNSLLPAGSYSTTPVISKDGETIVLMRPSQNDDQSGYGVTDAHENPAVLSVISVETLNEQKINISSGIVPTQPIISDDGKMVAYSAYSSQDDLQNNENGKLCLTNIATAETESTPLTGASYPLVFARKSQAVLLGKPQSQVDSASTPLISDAGNKYYPLFTGYTLFSTADLTKQEAVSSSSREFIDARSADSSNPAVTPLVAATASGSTGSSNIQIGAEEFRDGLAEQRAGQQNAPAQSARSAGSDPGGCQAHTPEGLLTECCDKILPGFSSVKSLSDFYSLLKKNGWALPKEYLKISNKYGSASNPIPADVPAGIIKWLTPEGLSMQQCVSYFNKCPWFGLTGRYDM